MIDLLAAILTSAGIFVLFRLFARWRIDAIQAIVVNYGTAMLCGLALTEFQLPSFGPDRPDWLVPGYFLGYIFIGVFYLMAVTSQKSGVAVASIATKMSMIIPVLFYGLTSEPESLTALVLTAILLGLAGVVLSGIGGQSAGFSWIAILLPFIVFAGSGVIDLGIAYFSSPEYMPDRSDESLYSGVPFAGAFSVGLMLLLYRRVKLGRRFSIRSLWAGIALGITNYGSLLFLVRTVHGGYFSKAIAIPMINLGVIVAGSLFAVLMFKEEMTKTKLAGLVLCMVGLLLMTFNN